MSLEETLKDLLKDLIKCPVCHEYPSKGPLLHCPNGHHVCQNCHPKIDTCPVCRADGMTSRSLLADGILGVIPLPCQFNINGCLAQNLVGKTRESHQSDCDFRDVNCPKCNDPVKLPDFLGHINKHNLVTIRFDEKSEFGFIPFVIPIPVDNSNGSNGENQDENETESNDENPDEAESNDENDAIEFEDANNSEDDTNEIENSDDIDINEFEEDIDESEEDIDESEEDIDENEEDSDDIAINEFEEDIDESEEDIYENEEDSDDIAINEFEEDIDENEEDSDDIAIDEFEEEIDENEESDITENDTDDIDIEESEDANNGDDDTDDNENSNDIEDANNGEDDTDEDDDTGELNINSFGNIQDFLQELVNRVNHHIEFHLHDHDHDHPDEDNESYNNDDEEPFDVDPIHVSFKEWHFFVMVKRDPKSETFHFWIYILGSPKEADKFSCQLEFQLDEAKKCTFDFPVVSMDVPSVTVVSRQSSLDLKQDFVKKGIVNGELPLRCKVEEKKRGRKRAAPDYDDDQ